MSAREYKQEYIKIRVQESTFEGIDVDIPRNEAGRFDRA